MTWREFVFATIGAFFGSLFVVAWPLRRARRELLQCQTERDECETKRARCEENCAELHKLIKQSKERDAVLRAHESQLRELRAVLEHAKPALELLHQMQGSSGQKAT